MATGSGLDVQFGFAQETTWGTPATPDHFLEINSAELQDEPEFQEGAGLRPGVKHKRSNRVRRARTMITGELELEVPTKGMGLLWKHILGSAVTAPTQIATSTAYKTNFVPGDYRGLGLTTQLGYPEPATGTVWAHTYSGMKIVEWEFEITDEDIPILTLTFDGQKEDTAAALATPSYVPGSAVFDFSQATLLLGGTASTTAGETTITGGLAASTIIREFTLTGETPMANERFGLGNAGLKAEQLENGIPTITGELAAEFNKAEFYDKFANNTAFAMQLTLTGSEIEPGQNYKLDFILPEVRVKTATPVVDGPEIVMLETEFEAYSDEANPVIQITTISDEATF